MVVLIIKTGREKIVFRSHGLLLLGYLVLVFHRNQTVKAPMTPAIRRCKDRAVLEVFPLNIPKQSQAPLHASTDEVANKGLIQAPTLSSILSAPGMHQCALNDA